MLFCRTRLARVRAGRSRRGAAAAGAEATASNPLLARGPFAAFSIASKDQGYALAIFRSRARPRVGRLGGRLASQNVEQTTTLTRRLRVLAAATVRGRAFVIDGAVLNPSGFAARLGFWQRARRSFAQHARRGAGRGRRSVDTVRFLPNHYPRGRRVDLPRRDLASGCAGSGGRVGGPRRYRSSSSSVHARVQLSPGRGAASRPRCSRRLRTGRSDRLRAAGRRYVMGVVLACSPRARRGDRRRRTCSVTSLTPRTSHARALRGRGGVETYRSNVYLPRIPVPATRVGVTKGRTMPGITRGAGRARRCRRAGPRWIVVPQGFAWRYLSRSRARRRGARLAAIQRSQLRDFLIRRRTCARSSPEKAGYRLAALYLPLRRRSPAACCTRASRPTSHLRAELMESPRPWPPRSRSTRTGAPPLRTAFASPLGFKGLAYEPVSSTS